MSARIAEMLPGVYADTWMGVAAPPGTPKDIVAKVSDAIAKGFADPEVRARILGLRRSRPAARPRKCAISFKKASSSGRR